MAERYTPYHLYPELPLNQASQARVESPALGAYQCPNSQNAFLAQYDHMQQRNLFDHATTSCCNEPVYNFTAKPQFQHEPLTPNPKDCSQSSVQAPMPCTGLARSSTPGLLCADKGGIISNIRVHCDQNCPMLSDIELKGSVDGIYGRFYFGGRPSDTDVLLTYQVASWIVDGVFENCTGESVFNEPFCGVLDMQFRLSAWMDSRDGCPCDCCGSRPPYQTITAPTISATYANTKLLTGPIKASESCPDGSISGVFTPNVGSTQTVPWTTSPKWVTDGTLSARYMTGTPGTIGGSTRPACCGGSITWSGTDGCGGSSTLTRTVPKAIATTPIFAGGPTNHILTSGTEYSLSVVGLCLDSPTAAIEFIDEVGLIGSAHDIVQGNGTYAYKLQPELDMNHEQGLCCGDGAGGAGFKVRATNGCGTTATSSEYKVRRAYGSGATPAGYLFWCKEVPRLTPGCNSQLTQAFMGYMRTFYCNGDIDTEQINAGITGCHGTLAACNQMLGDQALAEANYRALFTGEWQEFFDCYWCARLCDNGYPWSHPAYRAAAYCVPSYETCCKWPVGENATAPFDEPQNCYWVNHDWWECCPYDPDA